MTERRKWERAAAITEELRLLGRIPEEAHALLERELERLATFHTEKCCDPRLTAEESARHREARLLARNLAGFFRKREAQLRDELDGLRPLR